VSHTIAPLSPWVPSPSAQHSPATSNGENAQHLAIGAAASSGVLAIVTAADAVVRFALSR
jgi:hypothetical protein